MSLFKLKNFWFESFGNEQFDQRHLAVGKIDNAPVLALGGFSGWLRVYSISHGSQVQVTPIYQNKFQSEIIAIDFVAHPQQRNKNTIGVLLFRRFYYITLRKNLQTNTYESKTTSLTVDPAFALQPGSLSLLTLNSSIQYLNPLSTQPLKVSQPIYPFARLSDSIFYADGQELVKVQNSAQQWRVIVGPMRELYLWRDEVVVIGDNAIWAVQDSQITKTKVFEQDISCGAVIDKDTAYNVMVANFANQIFIYSSSYELLWAIKADEVPIKICIFRHPSFMGALALLSESGTVSVSYLGTELPQTELEAIEEDYDIGSIEAETKMMMAKIKSRSEGGQNTVQESEVSSADVRLAAVAKSPRYTKPVMDSYEGYIKKDGQLWSCQIECSVKCDKKPIYEVSVGLTLPSNVICLKSTQKIPSIQSAQKLQFVLFCSSEKFAYDNLVEVTLRYETADKRSCILTQKCQLPFDFQCSLKSLQLEQKPSNKIVFKAQKQLPPLNEIFYELSRELANTKNLTIKLGNGILCSLGYSKDLAKVKIQSNFFSGLCYMFVVLNSRLQKLKASKKIVSNQLQVDIPLEQFFSIMKEHFELRAGLKAKSQLLEKKCEEFRNTEKKIIIKMKQKATALNNIDKLLQYTYKKLIEAADAYEHCRQQLDILNHNLQIAIKFITEMLLLKSKATSKCRLRVQGILGYEKQSAEFGWEEKVMSSSAHFLNKKYNYNVDTYTFDQLYKTVLWVISKVNSGEWNQ